MLEVDFLTPYADAKGIRRATYFSSPDEGFGYCMGNPLRQCAEKSWQSQATLNPETSSLRRLIAN